MAIKKFFLFLLCIVLILPLISCDSSIPKESNNKQLIKNHEKIDISNETFFEALKNKDNELIKNLIKLGADINSIDNNGITALIQAIRYNNDMGIVEIMIEKGADINKKDSNNNNPLIYALGYKNYDLVNLLLDKGINTEGTLIYTIKMLENYNDIAKAIINNGVSSQELMDALVKAKEDHNNEMCDFLIDKGVKVIIGDNQDIYKSLQYNFDWINTYNGSYTVLQPFMYYEEIKKNSNLLKKYLTDFDKEIKVRTNRLNDTDVESLVNDIKTIAYIFYEEKELYEKYMKMAEKVLDLPVNKTIVTSKNGSQNDDTIIYEPDNRDREYIITPEPKIGMTKDEIEKSTWGKPKKINKTTTKYGVNEQWVYSGNKYIYFENEKVTAIQDSY